MPLAPLLGPTAAERLIDDDAREPSRQGGASLERTDPGERQKVTGLHRLFGVGAALEDAPGGAEQPLVVGRNHVLNRATLACGATLRQVEIGQAAVVDQGM